MNQDIHETKFQVLDSLLELQTTQINSNAETRSAALRRKRELDGDDIEHDSDELGPVAKRQKPSSGYSAPLEERHSAMLPHRDAVIQGQGSKRYRYSTMHMKSGSPTQIQSQNMASIQVRPNLYLDPAQPCI